MLYFGEDGSVSNPAEHYANDNYVVCRGATETEKLDALIDFYQREVITSDRDYYRQSIQWEKRQLTPAGSMKNTSLNPHCYERKADRALSHFILEILAEESLHAALREITGIESFRLYQTMLFDHTVTRPHQDWIYLDSRPNGHVIAAWLALEGIPEIGIRFYVYPGTQSFKPEVGYKDEPRVRSYDYFISEIDQSLKSWETPM